MKYLSDYSQEAVSKALEKNGAFFAFSQAQLEEQKKEGVTYGALPGGLICPVANATQLLEELKAASQNAVKQDLEENGLDAIIERELANHECWYTGEIEDAVEALSIYEGATIEKIIEIFVAKRKEYEDA